jgi:hypothetical protein
MMHVNWNYCIFGLCPSHGIIRTREYTYNVSETEFLSVLKWGGETLTRSNFWTFVFSQFLLLNTRRWTKSKNPVILNISFTVLNSLLLRGHKILNGPMTSCLFYKCFVESHIQYFNIYPTHYWLYTYILFTVWWQFMHKFI